MTKTVYELKRYYHHKNYRNGDLEADTTMDFVQTFSTRKAANEFLQDKERQAKRIGRQTEISIVKRGDKNSRLVVFTGEEWIHENTGSKEYESYSYIVTKKNL